MTEPRSHALTSSFFVMAQANEPLVSFVRKLLGIKGDGDVARVMHVFLDVDIRGTHKLDIETFFEYFGIEFSEYNKRAFRLLAFGDGQVTQHRMVSEQRYTCMHARGCRIPVVCIRKAEREPVHCTRQDFAVTALRCRRRATGACIPATPNPFRALFLARPLQYDHNWCTDSRRAKEGEEGRLASGVPAFRLRSTSFSSACTTTVGGRGRSVLQGRTEKRGGGNEKRETIDRVLTQYHET